MRFKSVLRLLLVIAGTAGATALAVTLVTSGDASNDRPHAAAAGHDHASHDHNDAAHQRPEFRRTLTVATGREPAPSASPVQMRALLINGKLPAAATEATVLTDEDCAADADAVSHCRNRLRLANGKSITVRHPHRMHDVPCMTPGEVVSVVPAAKA